MGNHKRQRKKDKWQDQIHQGAGGQYQDAGAVALAGQAAIYLGVFFTRQFNKSSQRQGIDRIYRLPPFYAPYPGGKTNAELNHLDAPAFGRDEMSEFMGDDQKYQYN